MPSLPITRSRLSQATLISAVLILTFAIPAQTAPPKRVAALTPFTANVLAGIGVSKPGWRKTKAAKHNRVYISTGNSLLQAFPDVGRTISDVRVKYLHN